MPPAPNTCFLIADDTAESVDTDTQRLWNDNAALRLVHERDLLVISLLTSELFDLKQKLLDSTPSIRALKRQVKTLAHTVQQNSNTLLSLQDGTIDTIKASQSIGIKREPDTETRTSTFLPPPKKARLC